jgi:hypothetical protein
MPCPYFEPQQIARNGQDLQGRLPLFDEYDGWCCAHSPAQPVPAAFRFSGCNHGHADNGCTAFPAEEGRRHRRFHPVGKTKENGSTLEVLVLEIENYAPLRSYSVLYSTTDEHLEPEGQDRCERAQILAFCRSYLRRFPAGGES